MKKSLLSELTHRSYSKAKNPDGTRTPQLRIGVEARIEYHPFLSDWGDRYQSIMRTALNALQNGQSEDYIEKTFQSRFDIDWAWADSIVSDAKGTFDQLTTARARRIKALDDDIKAGWKSVASTIELMEKQLENPTRKNMKGFATRLMGLKSKVSRLERKQAAKSAGGSIPPASFARKRNWSKLKDYIFALVAPSYLMLNTICQRMGTPVMSNGVKTGRKSVMETFTV